MQTGDIMEDSIQLHYGKCRIQGFPEFWPIVESKGQDYSGSAPSILTLLLIHLPQDPQNLMELQRRIAGMPL